MPSVLWIILGLALFLFGMHTLSTGLRHGAGPRARRLLETLTRSRWRGLFIGIVVTGVIQSSSATNVMVVSFVQAGLLSLTQAISVMLGANVGTTVTSQLLALDINRWAPLFVGLGAALHALAPAAARRSARRLRFSGGALIGFGALLIGMDAMRLGLAPIVHAPGIVSWVARLAEKPYLAIAAGAVLTGVIQSSSMTTGLTMVLVEAGLVNLSGALGIVLGANVGTVATTLLASIGTNVVARRAAVADLVFNLLGVALFAPFLGPFARFVVATAATGARQVANAHVVFNLVTAIAMIPVVPRLADFVTVLVPRRSGKD